MGLKLITPADGEPVTLAEARLHLRLTTTAEDALVAFLITAAREQAESYTRRAFLTQTWDYMLDEDFPRLPREEIRLPKPKLQSVTSVKYVDTAGVEQTLATNQYQVDDKSELGRLVPAYLICWPLVRCQLNAVTVRFVAGYGGVAAVPFSIKAAMLLLIGHLFEHREENSDLQVYELPLGAERLLHPYRVVNFAEI